MRNASLELLSVNTSQDETVEIADECFLNDPLQTKIGRVLLYGVLIVLSIAGNSLIITAVRNDKNTKPTVRLFIQNMSAADLLITLIYMPRMISIMFRGYEWLVDGLLGLILCKFVTVIHHTAIFVSIQTLVVLSVERFVAVAYPLKRNISKRLAKRLIAAMWLGSLVVRIPRVVALYTERNKYGTLICTSRKRFDEYFENAKVIYYDLLFYVFYLIPLVIIAFSYIFGDPLHPEAQNHPGLSTFQGAASPRDLKQESFPNVTCSNSGIYTMLVYVLRKTEIT